MLSVPAGREATVATPTKNASEPQSTTAPEDRNTMNTPNFVWLNNQGVRGSSGFELQREDRFTMSYREGSKVITIDIENGMIGNGKYAVLMGPESLNRWDDGVPLTNEQQIRVLENIREALAFQELVLSIES
jgi:hypothetical protein